MVMAYVYGPYCLQVHPKHRSSTHFPWEKLQSGWMRHYFLKQILWHFIKKQNNNLLMAIPVQMVLCEWVLLVQQTFVFAVQNSSRIDVAWKNSSLETLNLSSQVQRFKKSFALIELSLSFSSNVYLTASPILKQLLYAWLGNCFPICEIAWGH